MCDMPACDTDATHYTVVKAAPTKRLELCRKHMEMAHELAAAQLTKIVEYGRLDKAWSVHPGGMA